MKNYKIEVYHINNSITKIESDNYKFDDGNYIIKDGNRIIFIPEINILKITIEEI